MTITEISEKPAVGLSCARAGKNLHVTGRILDFETWCDTAICICFSESQGEKVTKPKANRICRRLVSLRGYGSRTCAQITNYKIEKSGAELSTKIEVRKK